jgi:hypothetical protein
MKSRIVYQRVFLDPPMTGQRILASEICDDADVKQRVKTLGEYTADNPYIPADSVHGLRYFVQSLSVEVAP